MVQVNSTSLLRRQKDMKRGIRFTLMVCGAAGTGKTSFVNSLLDRNIAPHKYQPSRAVNDDDLLPQTLTYSNLNGVIVNAADLSRTFDPQLAHQEPGIAITKTSVEIVDEDDSKVFLTVLETPGFGENLDNSVCTTEICNFLEQQFDLVLAEETKVRRNPRFQDGRVHVCLYFLTPTGHGLRELDVEAMRQISKYANVIPVIGRADSFTKTELLNFKRYINEDVERFKIPVFQFVCDEDEDQDIKDQANALQKLQPFAVVSSDETAVVDGKQTRVRSYPWGQIDINDTSVSDFPVLRSVLLGSHLQDLKDITHDYLYENYRTERLSAVADLKGDFPTEPPSMSNLAAIANSRSMMKFEGLTAPSTASINSAMTAPVIPGLRSGAGTPTAGSPTARSFSAGTEPAKQATRSILAGVKSPANEFGDLANLLKTKNGSAYSLGQDEDLARITGKPSMPTIGGVSPVVRAYSPSGASSERSESPVVDPRRLRKISETVPYMLRHQTLMTKQQKLEELERKSAVSLAKRAAELEKKAMQLKLKEKKLRERMKERERAASISTST